MAIMAIIADIGAAFIFPINPMISITPIIPKELGMSPGEGEVEGYAVGGVGGGVG